MRQQVCRARLVSVAVLVLLLTSHLAPYLARAGAIPPAVQAYARPGEEAVPVEPALMRHGVEYRVYYLTTGSYRLDGLKLFRDAGAHTFSGAAITALVVTANGQVVQDVATLAEVFSLYRAAALLYESPGSSNPLGGITPEFGESLLNVTANPFFIEQQLKGLFAHPADQYAEAMRGMLTNRLATPQNIQDYRARLKASADSTDRLAEVIDDLIEIDKFSNSPSTRAASSILREAFDTWERKNATVELGGKQLALANAFNVLEVAVDLTHLVQMERDRAAWLNDFQASATGFAALDPDQTAALTAATAEAEHDWIQRSNIILQFARDRGADLAVEVGENAFSKMWTDWAWQEFGKRTTGHMVAGAASKVFLGLAIGNLLYDLDGMMESYKVAERANTLRLHFFNGRLNAQAEAAAARLRGDQTLDGELVAAYRAAYMLEGLAAAQTYYAYADGVEATVQKNLLHVLNPLYWFKGAEWADGVRQVRDSAQSIEREVETIIGHPDFLEPAIQAAIARVSGATAQLDATAAPTLAYDIVLPGETARVTLTMENTGQVAWDPSRIQLVSTERGGSAPQALPLPRNVAPGGAASWNIDLVVSGAPGVRTFSYRLAENDKPFGATAQAYVILLPEQLKDLEQRLREQVDEWQAQGQLAAGELMKRLAAELERELERQASNFLQGLAAQCHGPAGIIVLAGLVATRQRRAVRRGRNTSEPL